jgi:hypothetical protein
MDSAGVEFANSGLAGQREHFAIDSFRERCAGSAG